MATGHQLLAAAQSYLGCRYTTRRPVICSHTDCGFDCSGLVNCAARACGVTNVATNSSGLARSMQAAGTERPLSLVGTIPGAILIRGPNKGYWGYGRFGHAGIDVGDRVHTIEIGSTSRPCHYGLIAGWHPSNYGLLPGFDYSGAPTPTPAPAPPLTIGDDDMAQIIEQPLRPGEAGRDPMHPQVAMLDTKNNRVLLLGGASMANDRAIPGGRELVIGTPYPLVGWWPLGPNAPGVGTLGGVKVVNLGGQPYHISWS